MAALMALVAIVAAKVLQLALVVNADLIDTEQTEAGTCKPCSMLGNGLRASFGKAVFAQLFLLLLLFLSTCLKVNDHTTAGQQIVVLG